MISIVMGGLLGDEGKGCFARWLAKQERFDTAVRTGAPNAGHTCEAGEFHQLPTSSDLVGLVAIPRGALVHVPTLLKEYKEICALSGTSLMVHPQATVIEELGESSGYGTMGMGVGKTRANRCLKKAKVADSVPELQQFMGWDNEIWDGNVLIEGSQGYGLSLHSDSYPFVTSADINPHALLSEAGAPFHSWPLRSDVKVYLVFRPITIRVPGPSGPLKLEYGQGKCPFPVEDETWGANTGQPKRAGEFDGKLARRAIWECNPYRIVLTFAQCLGMADLGRIEGQMGRKVNLLGVEQNRFIDRAEFTEHYLKGL